MASENIIINAAKAGKTIISSLFENTKEFLNELVHPNMTIEKIAEVAGEQLDDFILQKESEGLNYSAGKFKVSYLDETHFGLSFEMYFKDDAGKWYKSNGESDPRDAELLDIGAWKTLQTLRSVEFPITAPERTVEFDDKREEKSDEESKAIEAAEELKTIDAPKSDEKSDAKMSLSKSADEKPAKNKNDIDLDDLLAAKK